MRGNSLGPLLQKNLCDRKNRALLPTSRSFVNSNVPEAQMNLLEFFFRHRNEILQSTGEHVWLVGAAMLLAIMIGVPLGIVVARRPWLSKPILGTANIAE